LASVNNHGGLAVRVASDIDYTTFALEGLDDESCHDRVVSVF
jgi:hypothetical protein